VIVVAQRLLRLAPRRSIAGAAIDSVRKHGHVKDNGCFATSSASTFLIGDRNPATGSPPRESGRYENETSLTF
jgi:hypothetical protein